MGILELLNYITLIESTKSGKLYENSQQVHICIPYKEETSKENTTINDLKLACGE